MSTLAPHPRDTRRLVALTELLKASKAPGPEKLDQGLNALRTRLSAENARQRRFVLWSRAALATLCVFAAMGALLVFHQRASTAGALASAPDPEPKAGSARVAASNQPSPPLLSSTALDADLARAALLAQRRRFPDSPRSIDALFLLGRIEESSNGSALALRWYDEYLARAPTGTYAAEAMGRKMIIANAAQTREDAQRLAQEYLRRFPEGSYAGTARALQRVP